MQQPECAAALFAGWEETLIWSCLQGVMGSVYGDHPRQPAFASAVLGDFCFLAGKPCHALAAFRELVMSDKDIKWEGLSAFTEKYR